MRFYTKDECEEWLRGLGRVKPDTIPEIQRAHVLFGKATVTSISSRKHPALCFLATNRKT
jgi:hypothetical protein